LPEEHRKGLQRFSLNLVDVWDDRSRTGDDRYSPSTTTSLPEQVRDGKVAGGTADALRGGGADGEERSVIDGPLRLLLPRLEAAFEVRDEDEHEAEDNYNYPTRCMDKELKQNRLAAIQACLSLLNQAAYVSPQGTGDRETMTTFGCHTTEVEGSERGDDGEAFPPFSWSPRNQRLHRGGGFMNAVQPYESPLSIEIE
jgi:hypothetical protein